MDTRIRELEKKYDKSEAENRALELRNHNLLLVFMLVFTLFAFIILAQYSYRQKARKELVEERNSLLEKEKLLSDKRQMNLEEEKKKTEQRLYDHQLIISVFQHISQQNLEVKNFLYDLKINNTIKKDPTLHSKITEEYKSYNNKTNITEIPFLCDELLNGVIQLPEVDAAILNKSDKILLILILMEATSSQIALLFNTTSVSIRNRKVKLFNFRKFHLTRLR